MSLSLVLRQQDDGVGECGGCGLHLLHHHLSGAVDGQDVPWEILTGSAIVGGAGHCKNIYTRTFKISLLGPVPWRWLNKPRVTGLDLSSAVKRFNRIQNKSFCLHYICMCTVLIHNHTVHILKIFTFIHFYIHILIFYIRLV